MLVVPFDVWYFSQHRRVLAACLALAGNAEVAREATDEAFARALERWGRVSAMASPGGWVHVVALNEARRLLRRGHVERHVERRMTTRVTAPTTDTPLPNPELWMAVRALPVRQQTAVVLRYVGDLSEQEIACAMRVSRGTVASTLHDARSRLRVVLPDDLDERESAHD